MTPRPRLTAEERAEYGRRAEEFPPAQLVYSLISVECIIAAREGATEQRGHEERP